MRVDLDLAIVGAGPAGIATALFLAAAAPKRLCRIAVFEKETFPREKICAGAIGARAERLLGTIGVHVGCPSVPIRGLSVAARGRTLEVRSDAIIGRVVRRIEFDHALVEAARRKGVRVEEGARVTALSVHGDGVRLSTARGEIRARAVVGADGVGSFVRRSVGFQRGRLHAQVIEVDTDRAATDRAYDVLHFDLEDRDLLGYAWDFPTLVNGGSLMCRGLYALAPSALGEETRTPREVGDLLEARLERSGVQASARARKRFAERGLSLHEPTAKPRVLLVGEAAGIDPVLGEGIAQAIQYGAVAGPYLAARLDEDRLNFDDWSRVFSRSRLGFDLGLRTRSLPLVYGTTRPILERWVTRSTSLATAGMRYFAGDHVSRRGLARAGAELGHVLLEGLFASR